SGIRKTSAAHANDAACSVILVEQRLQSLEDFRMIFGKGLGSYFALFLTAPVADENGALGVRIYLLENPHRFQHGDGARSIIGRAGGAIPRIEVRREHHVLVGLLRSLDLGDRVEYRTLTKQIGVEVHADLRVLLVFRKTEDQAVVLAAQRNGRCLGVVGLEYFDRPPAVLRA